MRVSDDVYCFQSTAECALDGCVACAYKLLVDGPNARPEQCLSFVREPLVRLWRDLRVLTVGDGDLSFSVAVRRAGGVVHATTLARDLQDLQARYPVIPDLDITYGVDATDLQFTESYDRVVFNFPCVDHAWDGQNKNSKRIDDISIQQNQELIRGFAESAKKLLTDRGELWITHKTKPPFSWWQIPDLVSLPLRGTIVFDRSAFPPYVNRKAVSNKGFPAHDARIYIFAPNQGTTIPSSPSLSDDLLAPCDDNGLLLQVTPRLLDAVQRARGKRRRRK